MEDEPVLREMLALHLRRLGYEVETAPDGLAAWELLAQDFARFNLVITDNQMPRMMGIELATKLRAEGYDGKIIFFSSTFASQNAMRLDGLNIAAVVEKGAPIAGLMAAVQRAAGSQ